MAKPDAPFTARIYGMINDFPSIKKLICESEDGTDYPPASDSMMFYFDVPGNDSYDVRVQTVDGQYRYQQYVGAAGNILLQPTDAAKG